MSVTVTADVKFWCLSFAWILKVQNFRVLSFFTSPWIFVFIFYLRFGITWDSPEKGQLLKTNSDDDDDDDDDDGDQLVFRLL